MTPNITDPLAELFKDDVETIDRQQLATLVAPYISIDKNSKEFGFLPAFRELEGNAVKIEVLLAAAKARALYLNEPDGAFPADIIATEIMAMGSVKSTLKKLFDKHQIKKDSEGRYFLPVYHIPGLVKRLTNTN